MKIIGNKIFFEMEDIGEGALSIQLKEKPQLKADVQIKIISPNLRTLEYEDENTFKIFLKSNDGKFLNIEEN